MRVLSKRIHSNGIYGLDDGTSAKTKVENAHENEVEERVTCGWLYRMKRNWFWLY